MLPPRIQSNPCDHRIAVLTSLSLSVAAAPLLQVYNSSMTLTIDMEPRSSAPQSQPPAAAAAR